MKTKKKKPVRKHVIKVRKVPPEVAQFVAAPPPDVPEHVLTLVQAIQPGTEIHVKAPEEPSFWQRLRMWFED